MADSTRRLDELERHPKNDDLYGDEDLPADFVDSIREHGIREPLVVTPHGTIISGHRRAAAAEQVGLEEVPVRVEIFADRLSEWEAIVDYNRQRKKSPAQIVNEADLLMEIERTRAKERQGTRTDLDDDGDGGGGGDDDDGTDGSDDEGDGEAEHPDSSTRMSETTARDAVGEQLGVSGSTVERGLRVKEQAEAGDDTAQEEWRKMQAGEQTIHGAYNEVKDSADGDADPEPDALGPDTYPCAVCGDDWRDFEAVLADADGDTIPVEKVCVRDWPDQVVLHIPPEAIDT